MNTASASESALASIISRPFTALAATALVQVTLIYTWGLTGFGKLFGGGVPEWFGKSFGETFLAKFPGLTISFYSIALLEALAAVVAGVALFTGEALPRKAKPFTRLAIILSMALFAQLGFGKRLIADHDGAHDLFVYLGISLVMLLAVEYFDMLRTQGKRA